MKNLFWIMIFLMTATASAREFHVSVGGRDENDGSVSRPFRTISAAAEAAQSGDVITVYDGIYRERIDPPRGGASDERRIVYRAAPGEKVFVKGSEVVKGWVRLEHDTWKIELPNAFFGDFNPYDDLISGDWFASKGRNHHTGAVYVDGHWLTEAATLDDVLGPIPERAIWSEWAPSGYLFNVAWFRASGSEGDPVWAAGFTEHHAVRKIPVPGGGEGIGYIGHGALVCFERVNFGEGSERIDFSAATGTRGGTIQIRLDSPEGELLGTAKIARTGGWGSWEMFSADIRSTSGTKDICLVFKQQETDTVMNPLWDPQLETARPELWFAEVDDLKTTIWAQFAELDPNEADIEINVRQTVFYPERTGIDYITVRGFTMMHAATPWAPPTAEQIGLIGTNWSKGWIIEGNDISYSTCVGVTLGKHGDEWDNTSANTAVGYVETIRRAIEQGWSRENIGHHIVRNNRIAHCEQAGLVGSLGAIFSTISGNVIHDIHVRQLFTGAEMAGIKLHAPIDTLISRNHIFRTARGMWLDWMTQGTRVTGNLFHDNDVSQDLFIEVSHGPYVVDNNVFLSRMGLDDNSQGGAYLHNLFAGGVTARPEPNRETPYHRAHSAEIAGLHNIQSGDTRFYNNLFAGGEGLAPYDAAPRPSFMAGNAFLNGAKPARAEENPLVLPDFDPGLELVRDGGKLSLRLEVHPELLELKNNLITTEDLGEAAVPELPYLDSDGGPLKIDTDYFGAPRDENSPTVGPFEKLAGVIPGLSPVAR